MTRDPWRYCCPDCDSVSIRKRSQKIAKQKASMRDPFNAEYAKRYYCCGCNTGYDRVEDKKTGQLVRP